MTPSGQPVVRFSLATNEEWKDKDGNKKSRVDFHPITIWGKQAEIAEKYLRKGKQIYLEGKVQYNKFTDKAGVEKWSTDIVCEHFVMLGRKGEDGAGDPSVKPSADTSEYADDITF
jgi:single-strand DNA-binding protein